MNRMLHNKILKNASWIIICRIVQSVLSLVVSMIAARYLGPANYGLINYASSIVAFAIPLVQLGLNSTLVQEIIARPDEEGKVLGTSIILCSFSSVLGIIGCSAFVGIVNKGEIDTLIVCCLYSISMLFQMMEMIQYWYQAKLLSKYVAITSLIARFIVSIYRIIIIVAGKSIYWFAVVNSCDYFIIASVLLLLYRRKGKSKLSFSFSLAKEMFAKSKYYVLSDLMVVVFAQTDKIMLKLFHGDEVSGYYSAAIVCVGMTSFVFTAIMDSMRPVIFEYYKIDKKKYEESIVNLFSIIFFLALLQSICLTVFSKWLVYLMYGEQYAPTAIILSIVTWYSAFSYIGPVRNIWMLAEGKQEYLWLINLCGAIMNVALNFILIPVIGASGAAIASVVTQVFTNYVLSLIVKPLKPVGILMIRAMNPKVLKRMIARVV